MEPAVTEFDGQYAQALADVLRAAPSENRRTGKTVRAFHGVHFRTRAGLFPILSLRNISPLWACAEAVWFLSGQTDPSFMRSYGFSAWDKFLDADGQVTSATGFRWRKQFGIDQLEGIMAKLRGDPSTRQAVMVSWVPSIDLLKPGPNAPCVVAWHFEILEGALCMSVLQRSADMYFGLPHDILGFRIIQELMAAGLGVRIGTVSYLVSNAHLYMDQWRPAQEMVKRWIDSAAPFTEDRCEEFSLGAEPGDLARAMDGDRSLPKELYGRILTWYRPHPAITGPKLVV